MKNISLFVLMMLGTSILFGQQTFDGLKKAKIKSDKKITNEKKKNKVSTWEDRAILYLNIYQFNTKQLYVGMPTKGLTGAEILIGKPVKTLVHENKEEWIYERKKLFFENGKLVKWEETVFIDKDAIDKSYKAYATAIEMDNKTGKGKLKNRTKTKQNLSVLRSMFVQKGLDHFKKNEFDKSVSAFENSLELYKYPRTKSDTSYKPGDIVYYSAVIAEKAKQYDKSINLYKKAIKMKYKPAKSYHFLANVYKSKGDNKMYIATVEKGFELYPDSPDLLIDLINYYLSSGESKKALEYLGKAIEKDPKNATFYFAQGTLYDKMANDTVTKVGKEKFDKYINSAIDSYKEAIEKKSDYFDAYYNLGVIYNNKAASVQKDMQKIPLNQTKKYEEAQKSFKIELNNALPYMEKAHEINPKDVSAIRTLIGIYRNLKQYKKAKEMTDKLGN